MCLREARLLPAPRRGADDRDVRAGAALLTARAMCLREARLLPAPRR